jgi:release factor glutamine methyltransferase
LKPARPDWTVRAVDASADALHVAHANAQRLGLAVQFLHGDWLSGVQGRLDVIVSNPPYIAEADPHLPALHAEPRQALVGGADGLDDIRTITLQAPAHLKTGGWLLLEHGFEQATAVQALLLQAGFANVQSRKDLAGIPRCTGGQWPEVK